MYIKSKSKAEIIIAEGCGTPEADTTDIFRLFGYEEFVNRYHVKLVDLNYENCVKLRDERCTIYPEIVFKCLLISLPVLKANSLSVITGTLKNMIGLAPPKFYSGGGGIWKKSVFHNHIHQSIVDLNRYRTPDFTIMDCSVGLSEYHLGGRECHPHVNRIIAGCNSKKIDRKAAQLLGFNWNKIPHLL